MPSLARSSDDREALPRVLYLVTVEDSALFVRGQLAALVEAGFEAHFATSFRSGIPHPIDPGTTSWHLPFEREPSPVRDVRALIATIRLLRQLRPKVVHAGTPKAALLGMMAAKITRVPVRVEALHGLRYETTTGKARWFLKSLERLSAACATHILADSESIRRIAVSDGLCAKTKVSVIGAGSSNGVDATRFQPGGDRSGARRELGLSQFDLVIGFVGRLTRDKGVDDLVTVFTEQIVGSPSVGLLLVGPFEEGDPLTDRTRRLIGHDPRVVHIPWLEDTTIAYAAIDVLAFPSYREGLPNVPLEAQACGVPVVGYAATGTVDAVAPSQLVPVGNLGMLGTELDALVRDDSRRAALGRAGRAMVLERFDAARIRTARARYLQTLADQAGNHR